MYKLCCIFFLSTLLLMAGCVPFAPSASTLGLHSLPSHYSLYEQGEQTRMPWWEEFRSDELNRLIAISLADGFSIRQAWARLHQARAIAQKSGAVIYPDVSAQAGSSYSRQKTEKGPGGQRTYLTIKDQSLGLAAHYELDLWGRIHSAREATRLNAEASLEDVHTAYMTLSGQIVEDWLKILQVRKEQALVKAQIATNQTYLDIQELHFSNSLCSAMDVLQQREILAQSCTLLSPLEAREQVLRHSLAVLLGKSPCFELDISSRALPHPLPLPSTGIPADLLANRPDVRAAGLRLRSSKWEVSSAKADRLPAITLSATAAYSSDQFNTIFDNWLANLTAGLTGPIFDGNRRAAEVDRVKAVARERLVQYEETVMNAVREVEDALVHVTKQQAYLNATVKQLDAGRSALKQAREHYQNGMGDYLTVLSNLRNVQSLQRTLIQRQADLLLYQVAVHRALGGSWVRKVVREQQAAGKKIRENVK